MTEPLNIDHHRRQLLQKALEKANNQKEAAMLLGVSERTVTRLKHRYGIRWDSIGEQYRYPWEEFKLKK